MATSQAIITILVLLIITRRSFNHGFQSPQRPSEFAEWEDVDWQAKPVNPIN